MINCSLDLLVVKKCKPCEGGVDPLPKAQCLKYLRDRIAKVAQKENHHPDLHLTGYRKLRVELSTHAIGGLSENDFILAARIERLPKKLKV